MSYRMSARTALDDFDSALFTQPLDEERVGDGARVLWVCMVSAIVWALGLAIIL